MDFTSELYKVLPIATMGNRSPATELAVSEGYSMGNNYVNSKTSALRISFFAMNTTYWPCNLSDNALKSI